MSDQPLCAVPVFTVVITLEEEGQPLPHHPHKSLLLVQALQQSVRQIPQAAIL